MKNYYEALGLSKNATASEIKNAFKKMAKEYHPDLGGDSEKFKSINEAYQILNDSSKKAEYDIKLNHTNTRRTRFNFSFDDFFKNKYGSYESTDGFYDDPFVKSHYDNVPHSESKKQKTRGSDLKISLEIFPEDTIVDFSKKITYNRNIICHTCNSDGYKSVICNVCNGTGIFYMTKEHPLQCAACDGSGKIHSTCITCSGDGFNKEKKEVKINIPKGITIATTTRMKGFGNQGSNGEYGDLIIHIKDIISSSTFQISPGTKDKYVFTEEVIDFFDAITGIDIEYKTLRGIADVNIKPMQIFKDHRILIPNAGIPKIFGKNEYSPHIILFHIKYPDLSQEQIEYIKKIKDELYDINTNNGKDSRQENSEVHSAEDNVSEYTENKKE
jgi:molecular chaperone DnaJ